MLMSSFCSWLKIWVRSSIGRRDINRSAYCEEDLLDGDFLAELNHDLLKNNMKENTFQIIDSARDSKRSMEPSSKVKVKPAIKKVVVTEIPVKVDLEELGCKKWNHEIKTKSSIFTDAMMGQLLSTICCKTCKYKSYTFEPFYLLELPIPEKPKATLKDCFLEYCKEEEVNCNLWVCPRCKEKRKASKSLQIWRLPPILFIAFKRFKQIGDESKRNECLVNVNIIGEDLGFLVSHNTPGKLRSQAKIYQAFSFIVGFDDIASQGVFDERSLHLLS